ncbi:MAG: hypothetical protein H6Q04_240 [Acidobacteria bacterium]|nr:hypothetical protein [Acidobacteriota bacterium]
MDSTKDRRRFLKSAFPFFAFGWISGLTLTKSADDKPGTTLRQSLLWSGPSAVRYGLSHGE